MAGRTPRRHDHRRFLGLSEPTGRLDPNDPDAGRRLLLCMDVSFDGFVARTDHVIDFLDDAGPVAAGHGGQRHRIMLELLECSGRSA